MGEVLQLQNQLACILNDAQRNLLNHKTCLLSAIELLHETKASLFESEFIKMMNRVLIVSSRESHIERLVKFFGSFISRLYDQEISTDSQNEEDVLSSQSISRGKAKGTALNILEYLLDCTLAEDKGVRWRSTQIIGISLNLLKNDVDDAFAEEIRQTLLIRIQDKLPNIRIAAINGLYKLHNPNDKDDKVIREFIRILKNDVQKDVRKAIVKNLQFGRVTIPILLERTKDVAPEVRKEVYRSLSDISIDKFNSEELITLIDHGLTDRNPKVLKNCEKLITKYVSKIPIIEFISLLQPQQNQELIEKVIKYVISDRKFDFSSITPKKEYFAEFNILHRVYLQQMSTLGNDEYDDFVPEIYDICKQIIHKYQKEEYFDLKQLLLIAESLDYSNEAGRRKMSTILRQLLQEMKDIKFHSILISLLRKIHPEESEFLQILLEILADIIDPLDEENDKISDDENNNDIDENSSIMFVRALSICEEILKYTSKDSSHPGIIGLLNNYIIPSITHADCLVREKALSCLGLFCLLDEKEAIKYLLLFVKVIGSSEPDDVQLVAVRTLFDFLTYYGPDKLISQEKEWPSEYQVWNDDDSDEEDEYDNDDKEINDTRSFTLVTLVRCLTQTRNTLIRSTAVEGFAKLLLNNFINDFQIISVLLTLYFHPATDRDQTLTQCLGVFFPAYCLNSPKHTETLKDAFIPTLERILSSSQFSPLRKVNIEKVVQFMIMHIDMSNSKLPTSELPGHDELALGVAQLVSDNLNTNSEMSKQLCKVLSSMRITDYDTKISSKLSSLMVQLSDKIIEKPLVRVLNGVQTILHKSGKKRKSISPSRRSEPPKKRRRTKSPERTKTTRKRKRTLSLRKESSPKKKFKSNNPDSDENNEIDLIEKQDTSNPSSSPNEEGVEIIEEREIVSTQDVSKSQKVVISFSGFMMTDPVYNFTYLKDLVRDAKTLGAELVLGNVIDSTITHIVSPPNRRTMKTIVGSLTNRWIVVPEWLTRSVKAGKFLREELYGGKSTSKPFKQKKVFISKEFIDENPNKQFSVKILKSLITEAGKGILVKNEKSADFILCSKNDIRATSNHNKTYLTWKAFFEYLQPTVNIL